MGISDITLRPARDTDGDGIAALLRAVFAEYEGCLYAAAEFPELTAPAQSYEAKGGAMWISERDGIVAGTLAIFPKAFAGVWELSKVYLASDLRGSGIATQMLKYAIDFAQARGARRVILYSDTRFSRGHAFYAKHGFRPLPGTRVLHDVSHSLEFGFVR
ncbi:MAG: GNAT family N-acetyltransferase, partial [Beijerinckiaceae bacterium]